MTAKQLREERAKLHKQMVEIVAKAKEEKREDLTAEERAKLDKLNTEVDALKERIDDRERIEKVSALDGEMQEVREAKDWSDKKSDRIKTRKDYALAYQGWALGGKAEERHRTAAEKVGLNLASPEISFRLMPQAPKNLGELRDHVKALQDEAKMVYRTTAVVSLTSAVGGDFVQNEAMVAFERSLLLIGGVRRVARVIRTATGATLPWPRVDDTANTASIIAESSNIDTLGLDTTQVTLSAYMYTSKFVKVTWQLLQDSAFNVPSLIGTLIGERFARGTNAHFTTGTGTGQPKGVVVESVLGRTATDVHVLSYTDVLSLYHAVNPAYRASPSCAFMWNDVTEKAIKLVLDGSNRPLWSAGLAGIGGDFPDTFMGKPYYVNPDMASVAAASTGPGAAKVAIFGDFNTYVIRDAMDVTIRRADELFLANAQVGFVGLSRHDGKMVSASTVAMCHLITKATA